MRHGYPHNYSEHGHEREADEKPNDRSAYSTVWRVRCRCTIWSEARSRNVMLVMCHELLAALLAEAALIFCLRPTGGAKFHWLIFVHGSPLNIIEPIC